MPNLRKRSCPVSYIESSGEEDFEEKENVKKAKQGNARRSVKRRKIVDDPVVEFPDGNSESDSEKEDVLSKPSVVKRPTKSVAAANLSESGSDSEPEAPKTAKKQTTKSKRAQPKRSRMRTVTAVEEFDWSSVVKEDESKTDVNEASISQTKSDDEEDDDDDDWEDVEDPNTIEKSAEDECSASGIDITVTHDGSKPRKPKKVDLDAELRREVARRARLAQEDMHILHLLCLLGHGRYISRACSCPEVSATALSLIPITKENRSQRKLMDKLLKLAGKILRLEKDGRHSEAVEEDIETQMVEVLSSGCVQTEKLKVMAICALFRASGIRTRIIHSFCPVHLKPLSEKEKTKSKPIPKKKTKTQLPDDPDFQPKKRRRMLSEEDEEVNGHGPCKATWWLEALCDGRWVTVDVVNDVVDHPHEMERKDDSKGPLYVVGFEAEGACKDVTAKYASRWCVGTRKLRVSADSWEEGIMKSLKLEDDRMLDAKEDDEIRERLLQLPPPKSTGDYNNHPIYALTRHLKKYEVIYPPDAGVLHFHKGEPVFARENVRLCHTRETWLKEARVVRIGEEPAKVVASRTTSKQRVLLPDGRAEIELFGLWQTAEYDPPVAKDGIVPKNEHGNVDLFQERMMPIGCVRLRLPGLARIARKLEIDVAQAMVGWEFHAGRWAHPVFDGWIVCREHVNILCHAWLEAERTAQEKAAAKQEARAVGNWRLLVRGLMIRKRLQAKYEFEGSAEASRISSIADGMKRRKEKK